MNTAEPSIKKHRAITKSPAIKLPRGSCDCHAHIFGPFNKYPLSGQRKYTPHEASIEEYVRLLRHLGIDRAVLVQPTVYKDDNTALLHALGNQEISLRGVIGVGNEVNTGRLREMRDTGVRGIRINVRDGASLREASRLSHLAADLRWHIDLRISGEHFAEAEAVLSKLPADFVIAHMGQISVTQGPDCEAIRALLRLLDSGRCWVKLSAPMRMSAMDFPYPDVTSLVSQLRNHRLDRLLWGTDWPHTRINKAMPDDADLCDLLTEWVPDSSDRQRVLVENPAVLYGF
jgi:2-pyrone-4,6-dicarboxylate lactonase